MAAAASFCFSWFALSRSAPHPPVTGAAGVGAGAGADAGAAPNLKSDTPNLNSVVALEDVLAAGSLNAGPLPMSGPL
eukprot:589388-Prorocentrum_minimum.AAC.1